MQEIHSGISFPKLDACWLNAPDERTPGFLHAFAEVSVAIQTVLRARVPATYFESLASFRNLKTAYPMLVYQASLPFRGKMRSELTYDVLNPETLRRFFRTAKPSLDSVMAAVETRLRDAGLNDLAADYEQRKLPMVIQAVQLWNKSRKCLYLLIRGEGILVNTLVELGGLGRLAPKAQARRTAALEKRWRFQLRRLYPGTDFTWLSGELLDAATQALGSVQTNPTRLLDESQPPQS